MKTLIEYGADINHADKYGTTPVLAACESNANSLLPFVKAGADPKHTNNAGESLLNYWLTDSVIKLIHDEELKKEFLEARQILLDKGFVIEKRE